MLARTNPDAARELLHAAQDDVERQWRVYSNRASMAGTLGNTRHRSAAKTKKHPQTQPVKSWGRRMMGTRTIDLSTRYLGLPS